ncbi:MAG: 4-(cytidine 5'-diphospho)-2-C-methyl-D-erythritol kinase, partial [Actinobacteria bacterium]|nr:4-(cytidine 5'-diphospho)-2-C-methyl-D-erythritol kinase [Actinomycetota bacterium]
MIEVEAPAKLTVSLRVTGVRDDGYHLIDAEMVTLDFGDRLEIDPDGDGLEILGAVDTVVADEDNLVRRALRLVSRRAFVR